MLLSVLQSKCHLVYVSDNQVLTVSGVLAGLIFFIKKTTIFGETIVFGCKKNVCRADEASYTDLLSID